MTNKQVNKIGKAFQDMMDSNYIFNKPLVKALLSMPIPINYETWVFLHKIADGDMEWK